LGSEQIERIFFNLWKDLRYAHHLKVKKIYSLLDVYILTYSYANVKRFRVARRVFNCAHRGKGGQIKGAVNVNKWPN
jgi:hypothetical protein